MSEADLQPSIPQSIDLISMRFDIVPEKDSIGDEEWYQLNGLEEGQARPIIGVDPEALKYQYDVPGRAERFLKHRKKEITDFDVFVANTLELMLNGFVVEGTLGADFCGGTAAVADRLLKDFRSGGVVVIDTSEAMLRVARSEIGDDSRIRYLQRSVDAMEEVPDNTFDYGVCAYGFDYLPDVSKVLAEMSRVMKDGARLIIVLPHHDRNLETWSAGGNEGMYPDGVMVLEKFTGGDFSVIKFYRKPSTWLRLITESKFELANSEEPIPPAEAARYAPEVHARGTRRHSVVIYELINRKGS